MSKRTKSGDGGDLGVPTKRARSDPDPDSTRGKGAAAKPTFPATPKYFMQMLLNNHGKLSGLRVNLIGGKR